MKHEIQETEVARTPNSEAIDTTDNTTLRQKTAGDDSEPYTKDPTLGTGQDEADDSKAVATGEVPSKASVVDGQIADHLDLQNHTDAAGHRGHDHKG